MIQLRTCISGQSKLFYKWVKDAGFIKEEYNNQMVEISPLYAADFESFVEKSSKDFNEIKKIIYNENGSLKNEIYIK